jgi:hypothetical protein
MAEDKAKKQKEYIAITALVVVAIIIGINRFRKGNVEDELFAKKHYREEWKEIEVIEKSAPRGEKGVGFNPASGRIPFKSPLETIEKVNVSEEQIVLPSMKFQGMVWNSARPQVIINNRVYDVGDIIPQPDGFNVKVMDVRKEGIYLRYKGKDFLVRPK